MGYEELPSHLKGECSGAQELVFCMTPTPHPLPLCLSSFLVNREEALTESASKQWYLSVYCDCSKY